MKIAMVIDRLIPGGAENVCVDIINRFQNQFNFKLITISQDMVINSSTALFAPINIFNLKRKFKFNPLVAHKLHRKLLEFDIIHVHLRHTYRYVAWVKFLFRGKYKIILHDHEGRIYMDENPPFFEYLLIKPDYYIGVCNKLRIWATSVWNIEENNSSVLLNLPFFENRKSNFTIENDFVDFILVGNIKPIKNQLFAVSLIKKLNRKICLLGNNQDGEYFSKIKLFANAKLIEGVNVNNEILKKFKFGLCTSISESGPLVVIEYLIAEVPFLAYKVGGMAEAISEYFPEYFIDNLNIEDWIIRIKQIEANPISKEVYRSRLKRLLSQKFNPDTYKSKLTEIYNLLK